MAVEDLTYRDYWQILQRRWKLTVLATIVGGASGLLLAKIQTPTPIYRAEAVARHDPASGYEMSQGEASSRGMVATQVVFIRGVVVLGNVARQLGLIPPETPREPPEEYSRILARIRNRIDVIVDPRRPTGVIVVQGTGRTPEDAAGLVNAVMRAYREENIFELKKDIVQRRQFIEQKLAENEQQLNQAQLAYEVYRREHPAAAIEPGMQGAISSVARSEAMAQALTEKIRETRRQISLVRSGRAPSDIGLQMIVGATGTSRLQKLSGNYTTLGLELNHQLTELTAAHPLVQQTQERIAGVRDEIEAELQLILDAFQKQQEDEAEKLKEMRAEEATLPEEAMRLAQLARKVKVIENIQLQLRTQLEDALIKEAGVTGQVSILSPASPPGAPINRPDFLRFGFLGLAAGLFAGFVLAVLIESARFSLQTLRDLEETLDLPVLGISPRVSASQIRSWSAGAEKIEPESPEWARVLALTALLAPRSAPAESYRTLRVALAPRMAGGAALFTATSVNRGEGVTTVLVNLALTLSQSGKRVLLVESDLRDPSISEILGLPNEPGLSDLLLNSCSAEEAIRGVADLVTGNLSLEEMLLAPGMDHFHVMPCGTRSANTGELLESTVFASTFAELQSSYDVILFDSAALGTAADSTTLGRLSEIILVFDPMRTERADLVSAVGQLRKSECRLAGLFVNGLDVEASPAEEEVPQTAEAAL